MRGFHPGQYGCWTGRSAVDAVGVTIAQAQEAWCRGWVVGAFLMDVAAVNLGFQVPEVYGVLCRI